MVEYFEYSGKPVALDDDRLRCAANGRHADVNIATGCPTLGDDIPDAGYRQTCLVRLSLCRVLQDADGRQCVGL